MKVITRMVIAFLVAGALGIILVQLFIQTKLKEVYLRPIEDDLVDISMLLASMLHSDMVGSDLEVSRLAGLLNQATRSPLEIEIYDRPKTELDLHVYVTDKQSKVIFHSRNATEVGRTYRWKDVVLTLRGKYGARTTWDRSGAEARLYFYVASPIVVNGEIIGVVSVGKQVPALVPIYEEMRKEAVLGGVIAILFSTILGVMFTRWITKPIEKLTEYAESIGDGNRPELPELGDTDIGRLGHSFEGMRDALEGRKYVEQYVQTLTHEIKSPLSAIKGAAELLEGEMPAERRAAFMGNIHTESQRIQRLVDRMLELSSLEKKKGLNNPAIVSIYEVLQEIVTSMKPAAESREVTVSVLGEDVFKLQGERFLIHQALSNLVHNALDFSPAQGCITISINHSKVTVTDTGPGVPDYAMARVFERFYSLRRPDSGKKSSGLGLSIVRQVAELHGCDVTLGNGAGGGAVATFCLAEPKPKRRRRFATIPPMNKETVEQR